MTPRPSQAQTAPGASLPVVEHTLPNGMRFLILDRKASPTVAFMVHYPVGSVNERLGNTGIAHVLEHMLFKGTDEIGTRDAAAEAPILARLDATHDALLAARLAGVDSSVLSLRFEALTD
ncbi:MAG: insulinase family protein, partial [Longimicrobiales bacterium]